MYSMEMRDKSSYRHTFKLKVNTLDTLKYYQEVKIYVGIYIRPLLYLSLSETILLW